MESKKQRNWTAREEEILMLEVEKYKHILEGKHSAKLTQREKKGAWQAVTEGFNSQNTSDGPRTMEQLIKKNYNIRAKAKEAGNAYKKVPTGGGPAPREPTAAEAIWLRNHEGSATIMGIPGGIDSAVSTQSEQLNFLAEIDAMGALASLSEPLVTQVVPTVITELPDTEVMPSMTTEVAVPGPSTHDVLHTRKKRRYDKESMNTLRYECLLLEKNAHAVVARKEALMCDVLEMKKKMMAIQLKRLEEEERRKGEVLFP